MSLELRGVSVTYGRVEALKQIDLSVPEGQIVALIGANGAGKTTTLRAITGLARLRAGTVTWLGTRLDAVGTERIVEAGVAMVPEGRRIFPIMSVKDNLLMGAYLRRNSAGIRTDLDRVCARFPRLRERWHQAAGSLSGGEQQMVSVGRALMCRPKLLLLDEPSLGLAPMMVRAIATAILAVNREDGVTILLVEQNSRMALKLSRSAYVLETGSVALTGPSAELAQNDHIRRLYLGV
jgi:branched-chain amino acid transport system ATP-binding protein